MKNQLLVTAIGDDRPGIVARLTEVFVKYNGNLEESRMSILGGEFAAIMLVSVPAERVDALKEELRRLEDETISVTTKNTHPIDPRRFADHTHYSVTLTGADREGIVHQLSHLLRELSINIQTMDTDVVNAPETGSPLFRMKAVVAVPESVDVTALKRALKQFEDNESVDINISSLSRSQAQLCT